MTLTEVTFIRKNKNLEQMLQDVTSIYNKTLYYLRQSYFDGLKSGEQIKLPSAKELYHLIIETDEWKIANIDTYAKSSSYKLAMQNFFTYFKASNAYRKIHQNFKENQKFQIM